MNFDSKIAIVVRDDLATWQKLNVTACLTAGLVGANDDLLGEPYMDVDGNAYHALAIQPMIVLAADAATIRKIKMTLGGKLKTRNRTIQMPAMALPTPPRTKTAELSHNS